MVNFGAMPPPDAVTQIGTVTTGPFYEEYLRYCNAPSDINEHLPLLYELAFKCEKICEFGVGYGRSTRAFLAVLEARKNQLYSYDVKVLEGVQELFLDAKKASLDATLHVQSTLDATIDEVDLLLVDSHHTYDQVKAELDLHGDKVYKYICFHDVELYGISGQDSGSVGIWPAINEWMATRPEWKIKEHRKNNNGMLILERK